MKRLMTWIPCLIAAALVPAGASRAVEQARVDWISGNAVPIATVEAGHGFADLEPLKAMIGDARVVGLGEGTHGTREHFQLKHRLVEYLATELGFTLFAIEASMPESQDLDPYVRGGEGDPVALIRGMYFWTWRTEEVLALVEWMRGHNAAGGDLGFTGFDMQTPDVAAGRVVAFLEDVDPAYAAVARESYAHAIGKKRRGFGVGTMTFPIHEARGKRIRYSGWIRTEDVSNGCAGLWWRIDGEERGVNLGFDNMTDRGPRGTTDWTEYVIEMDVPPEAVNINFGVLLSASGTAWFDDLQVTLDGDPFDATSYDFGYEKGGIRHFVSNDENYSGELDDSVVHSGQRSLRLASVAKAATDMVDRGDAVRGAEAVLAHMIAEAPARRAVRPAQDVDWAVQIARVVSQSLALQAEGVAGSHRDRCMADNVLWLLERDPGARIVLWAHNGHIGRLDGRMGTYLDEALGGDYVPVGFTAGGGRYTAIGENSLGAHDLLPPPADSVEAAFAGTGAPLLMLDLRRAAEDDPGSGWLHGDPFMLSIGASSSFFQYHRQPVREAYDLLLWVADTTPAVQLPMR